MIQRKISFDTVPVFIRSKKNESEKGLPYNRNTNDAIFIVLQKLITLTINKIVKFLEMFL